MLSSRLLSAFVVWAKELLGLSRSARRSSPFATVVQPKGSRVETAFFVESQRERLRSAGSAGFVHSSALGHMDEIASISLKHPIHPGNGPSG